MSVNPPSTTPPPTDRARLVADVYRGVLCRGPDPGGLESWVRSPQPLDQVEAALAASPEGILVAAVRLFYLAVLARDPIPNDCTGLRSWLNSSLDGTDVQAAFEASPEGERVADVRAVYIELLGRDPLWTDNRGLRAWVESRLTIEEIRVAVMSGREYQARHNR